MRFALRFWYPAELKETLTSVRPLLCLSLRFQKELILAGAVAGVRLQARSSFVQNL
jgi:hypothetical protein